MNYPRFPDEPCDGYHPGEEQPAMHNDEPQKPVTIPASEKTHCTDCGGVGFIEPSTGDSSQRWQCFACNGTGKVITRTASDGAVEPASDLVERLKPSLARCDDYREGYTNAVQDAAAALTALQQRAETLERERDDYQARVIPAETRVVELEHRLLELGQTL